MRLLILLLLLNTQANAKTDQEFNMYFEGAMQVYTQFDNPSKEESEKFYEFMKSKWKQSNCTSKCTDKGVTDAKDYKDNK